MTCEGIPPCSSRSNILLGSQQRLQPGFDLTLGGKKPWPPIGAKLDQPGATCRSRECVSFRATLMYMKFPFFGPTQTGTLIELTRTSFLLTNIMPAFRRLATRLPVSIFLVKTEPPGPKSEPSATVRAKLVGGTVEACRIMNMLGDRNAGAGPRSGRPGTFPRPFSRRCCDRLLRRRQAFAEQRQR